MIAANVKIQEIRHGTLPQPVEQIAERAPNHEPEGGCRQAAVASMDPDKEAGDYSERERHQEPNRRLAEQSEAHAGVKAEHEIKEAGDGDDLRWVHYMVQDPPLRRLINEKSAKGEGEAESEHVQMSFKLRVSRSDRGPGTSGAAISQSWLDGR